MGSRGRASGGMARQTLWTSARGEICRKSGFRRGSLRAGKGSSRRYGTIRQERDYLTERTFVGNAEKRFSAGTPVVEIAELRPLPDVCRRSLESDASRHTALKHKQSGAILNAAMPYCGIPGRHQANGLATEQLYPQKIRLLLSQVSGTAIARVLGVTCADGSRIRGGRRPHPRHWQALAR